jgi:hypothetical protein
MVVNSAEPATVTVSGPVACPLELVKVKGWVADSPVVTSP